MDSYSEKNGQHSVLFYSDKNGQHSVLFENFLEKDHRHSEKKRQHSVLFCKVLGRHHRHSDINACRKVYTYTQTIKNHTIRSPTREWYSRFVLGEKKKVVFRAV